MRAKNDRLRTALIIIASAALALGVLAALVVFYPTGSYQPVVVQGIDTGSTFGNIPSSTGASASSSAFLSLTSSTTATTATTGSSPLPPGSFASSYSAPYPVAWQENNASFAVTGASLTGNQLTIALSVQMGNTSECVPVNIRLVADELGTLQAPASPAGPNFIFPDTGTCNGAPGATYSESLVFTLSPSLATPFLMTTGGSSNIFFNAATTTTSGVGITLPGTSD